MREGGYVQATLWVLASNRSAKSFYEAAGWAEDGANQQIPSGDRLVDKAATGQTSSHPAPHGERGQQQR